MVSIELPTLENRELSIPATALLPAGDSGQGRILLLENSKLVGRAVQLGSGLLPGGRLPVKSGLSEGDKVVVAGAPFLSEGQAAVEHTSTTLLHGAKP